MENINIERYKATEIPMHKATQLIAFLGKHLGYHQADDSHATVVYDPKKDALVGKLITINGQIYSPELQLRNFHLALISDDKSSLFELKGQTIPMVIKEVERLMDIDVLPDFAIHYDLPKDYQLDQYQLELPPRYAVIEWTQVRQMAAETLEMVNIIVSPPSPVNIWPHHFDTGTYHILTTGNEGDSAAIGCGFAVADTIVSEPYFYIYGWSKDKSIHFEATPDLLFGEWKKGNWKGAVLPLSTVLALPDVKADLKSFFEVTVQFYKNEML